MIRTLQIIYSSEIFRAEQKLLAKVIKRLARRICDPQLGNLNQLINPLSQICNSKAQETLLRVVHNYTSGNYGKVQQELANEINENPDCFDFLELYMNAAIHNKTKQQNPFPANSLASDIFQKVYSIKIKDKEAETLFDSLLKIANILGATKLSNAITAFVRHNKNSSYDISNTTYEVLNYSVFTPRYSIGFKKPDDALKYLKTLSHKCPDNTAMSLYEYVANQRKTKKTLEFDVNVPEIRKEKHVAYGLKCSGNYEDAAHKYYSLYLNTKDDPLNQSDSLRNLTECLIVLHQFNEWLRVVVDTYLMSPNLLSTVDLLQLHKTIKGNTEAIDRKDICWPIYYSLLYRKDLLPNNYMHLYCLYDDFMVANGFSKIEDVKITENGLLKKRFVYFLKYVSVSNVIDNSVKFRSTEELEKSLISKYQILQHVDSQNTELYSTEIRKITQSAMIRRSIQRINQSRIHVDIPNVKASLDIAFPEIFNRYSEYLGLQEKYRRKLKISKEIRILFLLKADNGRQEYEDAAFTLFLELFIEIRKKYTINLDSYLSTRIRHGTLSGQIRSVFEKEKLITSKDKIGTYETNTYWMSILEEQGEKSTEKNDNYFKKISKYIDATIDKMKSNWIQIKINEKPEGLFDYNFSSEKLFQIYNGLFAPNVNSNILFNKVIEVLNDQTTSCLEILRKKISEEIKPELIGYINDLSRFIESNIKTQVKTNIIDAIGRCRTEIPNCLDLIEDWFDGIGEQESPDFTLSHLLDTVIVIINNCFPGSEFEPQISISEDCTFDLKGCYFNALIDIFFTVSENIVKHAQNQLNTVDITINQDSEYLKAAITNEISKDTNVRELTKRLNGIRSKLATEDISELTRTEGGSGLYKICRILQNDLHHAPGKSYGFGVKKNRKNRVFEIWIKLKLEILA